MQRLEKKSGRLKAKKVSNALAKGRTKPARLQKAPAVPKPRRLKLLDKHCQKSAALKPE